MKCKTVAEALEYFDSIVRERMDAELEMFRRQNPSNIEYEDFRANQASCYGECRAQVIQFFDDARAEFDEADRLEAVRH